MGILAMVFGILFTGCDINIGGFDEDDLILSSGYAWVTNDVHIDFNIFDLAFDIDYEEWGLIFKYDGHVDFIEKDRGYWYRVGTADYSTSGNKLFIEGELWGKYHVDRNHGYDELEIGNKDFKEQSVGNVINR